MPQLDDAMVQETLDGTTLATTDLIQVYDVSTKKAKVCTIASLLTALDTAGLASDAELSSHAADSSAH